MIIDYTPHKGGIYAQTFSCICKKENGKFVNFVCHLPTNTPFKFVAKWYKRACKRMKLTPILLKAASPFSNSICLAYRKVEFLNIIPLKD